MELGKEVQITGHWGEKITAYEAGSKDNPYLEYIKKKKKWNPDYPQDKLCKCGHPYYRHFDSYEDMEPCGCKYCGCHDFIPVE